MRLFGSAAILAGGKSSRMGFDKQLLSVQEQRLMELLIRRLHRRFSDVMVITNKPELYIGYHARVFSDIMPGQGPLSGIHAAATYAKSSYVYCMACDMPHISLPYIDELMSLTEFSLPDACVTSCGQWIEPFHAFYAKSALPAIEADLTMNKASIYYLLNKVDTLRVDEQTARRFTPDWDLFMNLNTREDYMAFLSRGEILYG